MIMKTVNSEITILVRGNSIQEFKHEGLTFIEGRHGSNFEISIKNRSNKRRLCITSVDGLSTIDGELAGDSSKGFIIDAFESISIPGWLQNEQTAAKFYFSLSKKEESYAQKMGHGDKNNGVIGVRIFDEKQPIIIPKIPKVPDYPVPWNFPPLPFDDVPLWRKSPFHWESGSDSGTFSSFVLTPADNFSMADTRQQPKELGTGWGKDTNFSTVREEFEKGDHVEDVVIYYDTLKGLKARGVDVFLKKQRRSIQGAEAFPSDYCTRPK